MITPGKLTLAQQNSMGIYRTIFEKLKKNQTIYYFTGFFKPTYLFDFIKPYKSEIIFKKHWFCYIQYCKTARTCSYN